MIADERIELRIAADDKAALTQRAAAEGVTLSTLMRRGIRSVLGKPEPLGEKEAIEIIALRRRVNAIAARVDEIGTDRPEAAALRSDIGQLHADAQTLLGRS